MKQYILLLIAVLFVTTPVAAVRPMTSLFAEELGATIIDIGIITACYSLAPLFLAVFMGKIIDRIGEKLPLIIGSISMMFGLVLPFLFPSIYIFYVSHLFLGAGQIVVLVSAQNGIAQAVLSENRNKAIATLTLFTSIGLMLGPLIGGYATEHIGFQFSYLFFSFFSLILFFVGLFLNNREIIPLNTVSKTKTNSLDLLYIPGLKQTIFVSMLILTALDLFNVYYPLYASSIGMNPSEIGWILTIQALASVVTRVFMPALVKKIGMIRLLSIFMFLGAVAYGIVPIFETIAYIFIVVAIIGAGLGIVQPLTIILTYDLSPSDRTAEVLSVRLAGNRLAQVILPLLFAGISNVTGLGIVFTLQACLLGTGALIANSIKKK